MVRQINAEQFKNEAMKSAWAVVDFNATWCGPCRMLAPVLEALSEELGDKVDFYGVDVDENPDLAAGYGVQSIPNLVLLKNGEAVSQSIGFQPQAALSAWIRQNIG